VNGVLLKVLAAAALGCLIGGAPADAATVRQTLDAFGFFGTWARDCDKPASLTNNQRVVTMSPRGRPMFIESLGPDSEPNVYVILRARRPARDTIVLRVKLNGGDEQDLIMRHDHDRIRTIDNREVATGTYIVRKGVVASTKDETPWLTRCAKTSE
jgi:hypothetical protein